MFGFLDSETHEVARELVARARKVADSYLGLSRIEMAAKAETEFPPERRFVAGDQISFRYDDLLEFSFGILWTGTVPLFCVMGQDRYSGFMLQRSTSGDDWHCSVEKPIAFPVGARAQRLADILERTHGVRDLGKVTRRIQRRF